MIIQKNYYRGRFFLFDFFKVFIEFVKTSINPNEKYDSAILLENENKTIVKISIPKFVKDPKCDGCMECVEICPTDCISIKSINKNNFELIVNDNACLLCSLCAEECHVSAITLVKC